MEPTQRIDIKNPPGDSDIKIRKGRPKRSPGDCNIFIRGVDAEADAAFGFLCGAKAPAVVFGEIVRREFERRAQTNEHARYLWERLYGGAAP